MKKMLPEEEQKKLEFSCCCNTNDVLFRFFQQKGRFSRKKETERTLSPSMDINIPYNIER